MPTATNINIDEATGRFLKKILTVSPRLEPVLIEKAFRFSWTAHKDQLRRSGEPYLAHPVAVAIILAEQHFDAITIAAGLLHDVLEDTSITMEELTAQFGAETAHLVDGVTKIRTFQIQSHQERQAETYRKMLLSMARDLRVIIIKFADRLHNLRTLRYLEPQRIQVIARETLDIYAPLASRLGMARIKWELEDLAFKYLHPDEYKEIVSKVVASRHERETVIEGFAGPLRRRFAEEGITAVIVGRPKHFYSIYRKMTQRGKTFEEIFDLLAIRVLVDSIKDCYHALGIIHGMWKPINDRFKDYISTPKPNEYQSLHTTVFGEKGNVIEVQIRTNEMNQIAEDGVAAHWLYKDGGGRRPSGDDRALGWLKNLIEWQKDLTDSSEFYEFFRIDLFDAEIFVFTPKGDLISLPKGATVLDFAFTVHTQIGLHCMGAKVDGKFEAISTPLKSGSTVDILYQSTKKPSLDWLREVKTPKARSAIRRWFKGAGRQESIELGRRVISADYKKAHLPTPLTDHLPPLMTSLGVNNLERLYELIGTGEIPATRVQAYFREQRQKKSMGSRVVSRIVDTFSAKDPGVLVGGTDSNIMVRYAKCCNPIPGDVIVGFVTRGRGISVHRTNCQHAVLFAMDKDRVMPVSWDKGNTKKYVVVLDIDAQDRPGLLHDITDVFLNFGANVVDGRVATHDNHVHNTFRVDIQNRNQLKQIFGKMQKVRGVEKIQRSKDPGTLLAEE